jgi:hypothetical protein
MRQPTRSATDHSLGADLVGRIAADDRPGLVGLLSPTVSFRGLTPGRTWQADTAARAVDIILGTWFGPGSNVSAVLSLETDRVGDVEKVSYRMAAQLSDGPAVIEQVAYFRQQDSRIAELRVLCSGFRPV